MNKIFLSELTAQKLRENEYIDIFPEYYRLKDVTEIGTWHDHQNVFDHVVRVYENLEKEIAALPDQSRKYLAQSAGNKTREEVLKIATLLHDIAKSDTLMVSEGSANCTGHEHIAAGQVKNYQERFDLDPEALSYVERIVLHHGFISDILYQVIDKPEKEEQFWNFFTQSVGDIWYELLLLMRADLHGADLNKTQPNEFNKRDILLDRWLREKELEA